MGVTKIEWTGKTWNPIRARNKTTGKIGWFCEHVSEGCRNCYAEKMNVNTYFGNGLEYKPALLDQVELFLDEKILQQPLHWRRPTSIFPCSMTDLFGRWVKDEWLLQIFDVMRQCPRHTFQILTKRPERMKDFCSRLRFDGSKAGTLWLANSAEQMGGYRLMGGHGATGMPWVWLGVSVEDQKTADERIPLLLETLAAVRWISAEPLLGPVDIVSYLGGNSIKCGCGYRRDEYRVFGATPKNAYCADCSQAAVYGPTLDWVVVGGESGPKARPMHPDWARSLRDQCVAAGVPFFFKQWGEWGRSKDLTTEQRNRAKPVVVFPDGHVEEALRHGAGMFERAAVSWRVGKKIAGRSLDGREWNEYPAS